MKLISLALYASLFLSFQANAVTGWAIGVPIAIQKSDWSSLTLTYIQFATPVDKGSCSSGAGVVFLDSHPSSKVALSFAMTALASGKKFKCWIDLPTSCSQITGSIETFPVCAAYPTIEN